MEKHCHSHKPFLSTSLQCPQAPELVQRSQQLPVLSSERHYKHSDQVNSCLLQGSAICGCHTDQGSVSSIQ